MLERRFLFFPVSNLVYTPADVNLEYEDIRIKTSDGLIINGWFIPGSNTSVTWLWFHGNGGNLGYRIRDLELARHYSDANIFIFDYHGYGESEGVATEKNTYLDSRAVIDYLQTRPDVDSGEIVYVGHSLGAAVAIELALSSPPMAMILISPFASVRDMANLAFPFRWAGWFLKDHYDSISRIQQLKMPILVLHGGQDDVVPIDQGRKLYMAANDPKRFQIIERATHNNMCEVGGGLYWGRSSRSSRRPKSSRLVK